MKVENMTLAEMEAALLEKAKKINKLFTEFFVTKTLEERKAAQMLANESGVLRAEMNELSYALRSRGVYVAEISFFDGVFGKVHKLTVGGNEYDFRDEEEEND